MTNNATVILDLKDEKHISVPYNLKNVLVTEKDIEELLSKFGIRIKVIDLEKIQTALTHKSYIEKNFEFTQEMLDECKDYPDALPLQKESYERLEFFGDSVVDKVVRKYLLERFPTEDEGFLTTIKTKLVDTDSLSRFSRELGLTNFIIVSKQVEGMDNGIGRASSEFRKILEDVFEAFIGAMESAVVDLDFYEKQFSDLSSYIEWKKRYQDPCTRLIVKMLETKVDFAEIIYNDTNYKNQLLQYFHKMKWGSPIYKEEFFDGPAHKRLFVMCVMDHTGKEKVGSGKGKRKKDGEQMAARQALIKFGVIEEDEELVDISSEIFV